MAGSSPIQNNFNGGEISPLLKGRIDLTAYNNGLETCQNAIPRIQGCLVRRPGTKFIKEVKNSENRTHLIPFIFNNDIAFILEFGDNYIRFYKDRQAYLVSAVHYEISSPYDVADLFDNKGIFRISFAQSADVIYMCHRDYPPKKLKHNADDDWTIEDVVTTWGPFDSLNVSSTTVYSSQRTGTATLTASSALFVASDVGLQFYIEAYPDTTNKVWEVDVSYADDEVVRVGGRYYKAVTTTDGSSFPINSGTVTPTHQEGVVSDGKIDWLYIHSGYGYGTITDYTSATEVEIEVVSRIPDNAVGSGNATTRWAFSAWGEVFGYPENVTFFKERLVYSRDVNLWFSVVGDYDNFALKDGPDLAPDMGLNLVVLSGEYNSIKWMYPLDELLLGTIGNIQIVGPNTSQEVFSASNVRSKSEVGRGSLAIPPKLIDNGLVFIQRTGRSILSLAYDISNDKHIATDVTIISEHLFKFGITQIVYQERPDSILWAVRNDGKLLGLTLNESQEVRGWHLHDIAGGIVESIAVIPSEEGDEDDLWLIVKRTIDGVTRRYIELLSQYFRYEEDTINAYFVDCGITYSGIPTVTITGLSHLEGQVVSVLGNGAVQPDKVVSGGQITLSRACAKAHIGLKSDMIIKTLNIEGGSQKGVSAGKTKRMTRVSFRLFESVNGEFGASLDRLSRIFFRKGSDNMNKAIPLFTGDTYITWDGGYDTASSIIIKQSDPLPFTLLAIMPEMETFER